MPDMIITHLFGKVQIQILLVYLNLITQAQGSVLLPSFSGSLGLSKLNWFCVRSQEEIHNNHDLIGTYRHHVLNDMNQFNLHLFVKSYER